MRSFVVSAVTRAVIARTLGGHAAAEVAAKRWGAASEAAILVEKTGVSGVESGDYGTRTPDSQFFGSVIERVPFAQGAWRQVNFNTRLLRATGSATGVWVAESKPIRVSKPALAGSSLPRKKVAGIVIQTQEAMEDPLSETVVENELRAGAIGPVVIALLDPDNAGSASTPKSITHSSVATQIAATAEPGADIAAAIEAFDGDLSQAIWLLDPVSATQLALARDASGNYRFPNIGPRGGSILNMPAFTFRDIPRDSSGGLITLVDPSRVAYAFDSLEISRSTVATLEADDSPTGQSDTPVAASATLISLFQADLVAHKIVASANWEVQRANAVAVITGANYAVAP